MYGFHSDSHVVPHVILSTTLENRILIVVYLCRHIQGKRTELYICPVYLI